ncbi:hypothetical protein [Streptomyces sp. NBC_00057]|uniref:hypothetical protein n=1 Tax=Streptomyces sp. NBC_00057 TaxID=2975634 RepID=UPI002F916400
MADSLHTCYMAASDAWRTHFKGCQPCQIKQPCPTGAPLRERFTRLQNAYLNHLRNH